MKCGRGILNEHRPALLETTVRSRLEGVDLDSPKARLRRGFIVSTIYPSTRPHGRVQPFAPRQVCVNANGTETRFAKINGIHIERGAGSEYSCHRVGRTSPASDCKTTRGGETNLASAVQRSKTRLNASVM